VLGFEHRKPSDFMSDRSGIGSSGSPFDRRIAMMRSLCLDSARVERAEAPHAEVIAM